MIYAGQKVRASELNDLAPMVAMCMANTSVVSSTTPVLITGMELQLEDETDYLLEGFVTYFGATGGDLRLSFAEANGLDALIGWSPCGPAVDVATDGTGEVYAVRIGATNFAPLGCASTSTTAVTAMPRGYVSTIGGSGGTLRMMMAQNSANATATTVEAGSWMRLTKVAA